MIDFNDLLTGIDSYSTDIYTRNLKFDTEIVDKHINLQLLYNGPIVGFFQETFNKTLKAIASGVYAMYMDIFTAAKVYKKLSDTYDFLRNDENYSFCKNNNIISSTFNEKTNEEFFEILKENICITRFHIGKKIGECKDYEQIYHKLYKEMNKQLEADYELPLESEFYMIQEDIKKGYKELCENTVDKEFEEVYTHNIISSEFDNLKKLFDNLNNGLNYFSNVCCEKQFNKTYLHIGNSYILNDFLNINSAPAPYLDYLGVLQLNILDNYKNFKVKPESFSKCAKLSSKGQVNIPKAIKEYLNVSNGEQIEFKIIDGNVILTANN